MMDIFGGSQGHLAEDQTSLKTQRDLSPLRHSLQPASAFLWFQRLISEQLG